MVNFSSFIEIQFRHQTVHPLTVQLRVSSVDLYIHHHGHCRLFLYPFLSLCPIAVKRKHDHGNSYKEKDFIGVGLQFWSLARYHHGGKHVAHRQACWRGKLRVLHPDWQAAGRQSDIGPGLSIWHISATRPHLLLEPLSMTKHSKM